MGASKSLKKFHSNSSKNAKQHVLFSHLFKILFSHLFKKKKRIHFIGTDKKQIIGN